jgi:predicted nucleic acid-binding protein
MRLVLDSNILFAGLLRDSTTRHLLIDPPVELVAPDALFVEIQSHQAQILRRSGLDAPAFEALLRLLTEDVQAIGRAEYEDHLATAHAAIGAADPGDVPFLAVALALDCDAIWTQNTKHFQGGGVAVWTTGDVIDFAAQTP